MKLKKMFMHFFSFLRKNYIVFFFIITILFVGLISALKLFSSDSEYVYVKVKVSQGMWWANTARPNKWYVEAIKKGEVEKSLTGEINAEIISVRYYPWWGSDQFDVYLTVKIDATENTRTGQFSFKRAPVSVASPIDFEFPSVQVSGTIIALSEEPFADEMVEKVITLTKRSAYPWEFDAIQVGDMYFDGEEKTFEILKKSSQDTNNIEVDNLGNYPGFTESRRYIIVEAKVKMRKSQNELIFGEDQVVRPGKSFNIATPRFIFEEYKIASIKDVHLTKL